MYYRRRWFSNRYQYCTCWQFKGCGLIGWQFICKNCSSYIVLCIWNIDQNSFVHVKGQGFQTKEIAFCRSCLWCTSCDGCLWHEYEHGHEHELGASGMFLSSYMFNDGYGLCVFKLCLQEFIFWKLWMTHLISFFYSSCLSANGLHADACSKSSWKLWRWEWIKEAKRW